MHVRQAFFNKVIIGLIVALAVACQSAGSIRAEKTTSAAVSAFQNYIQSKGSITFRSWNGKALRMDSDTELVFFQNSSVYMLEWGITLTRYSGTYQVQPNGQIKIQLINFERKDWPDMVLESDLDSLLLRPVNPNQGFVMGNRGGATLFKKHGSYWPFRMLTGDEEKKVLEMVER